MTANREQVLEARLRSLALAARVYLDNRFTRPRTRDLLIAELSNVESWLKVNPAAAEEPLPEPDLPPAPDDPLVGREGYRAVAGEGRTSPETTAADAWKSRAPYADA
ncbi:MAG: hypothetical protein WD341_08710 [Tistlia sp.]|uniref:hypothetical protein n=1 Tax=Tistlia sp. TaxID=3057121 RepID=UPI0034A4C6BF